MGEHCHQYTRCRDRLGCQRTLHIRTCSTKVKHHSGAPEGSIFTPRDIFRHPTALVQTYHPAISREVSQLFQLPIKACPVKTWPYPQKQSCMCLVGHLPAGSSLLGHEHQQWPPSWWEKEQGVGLFSESRGLAGNEERFKVGCFLLPR